MKPRIRIFVFLFAVALALPATASANPWASINSLPLCVSDTLPAATTGTDTTTVPSGWRNASVNVNLQGTGVQGFEWKIDCGPTQTGPTATISGTQTHSFLHRAQESGTGNWTPWVEDFVRVDTTLPLDTSTVPAGWQHDAATITLTGTDTGDQSGVSHMIYKLDGDPEAAAAPGTTFDITANGTHSLQTSVVDFAGNRSTPQVHIVQVDSADPVDTSTVPAGWVTTPSVDVTASGTDSGGSGIAQIDWQLVEDARSGSVPGAGPVTVSVSGEGTHTFRTRVTDADGRTPTPAWKVQTVRIDTTAPVDNTNVTTAWQSRTSVDVNVLGSDVTSGVARVEYRIDGGTPVSVNGPSTTATITGTGEHTLEVQIVDVAGNTSGWQTHTVRLDPDAPVNATPTTTDAWRQTAYTVRLNANDTLSGVREVVWKVDGGAETKGAPGVLTAQVSGDGVHTLSTRAVDNAGNMSAWRDETVRIDSVKPVDTTTSAAVVPGGRKVPVTGTDGGSGLSGSVEWQLDNGAVRTSSQATIAGAGPHVLKTRVQDNAGNWSDWKTLNVTVNGSLPLEDADAPVDNTSVPVNWRTGPVEITVTADDGDGMGVDYVEWRIDGEIFSGANHSKFTLSEDGVYDIDTRATDGAGNTGTWREHTLKIDKTRPVDTSTLVTGWVNSRDIALTGTDATSGVDNVTYRINGGTPVVVSGDHANFTLPGDGTFTITHQVTDAAGHQSVAKTDTVKVDTVIPVNTSGAAPTTWQSSAISLPLTGTDGGSGVDRFEYRVAGGAAKSGVAAVVDTDGSQVLETRVVDKAGNVSAWRAETVKVDLTKPVNKTPAVTSPWRKANFATTVTGEDATSGVARVEWKIDTGTVSSTPAVAISQEGTYKLHTRVLDVAGNDSGWRTDVIGIDKTAPTLAADCGGAAWRNTPAVCRVIADGGISGLATLTGARGGEGPVEVAGGLFTVEAEGSSNVTFRAVDGAGNEVTTQGAVKVDRTPPATTVTCTPDAKSLNYNCTAGAVDPLSGLTGVAWSLNGGAATKIAAGGTFTVAKGKVVVTATDTAGNKGTSAPATLAERHEGDSTETVTPRSTSEAVLLGGKARSSKRLVGQLSLSSTPTATTVDLRPLALGKGTFRLVLKVKVGKKTKTFTKTQKTVKGYSKRVTVKAGAGADVKVALTVKRKSGKRWVKYAAASAHL